MGTLVNKGDYQRRGHAAWHNEWVCSSVAIHAPAGHVEVRRGAGAAVHISKHDGSATHNSRFPRQSGAA